MVDVESIRRASELINSILFAKGFFEEGEKSNDCLLFKSINQEQLETEEQTYENDKLTINTIYALIQNYDKSKQERTFLLDQLNDKKEIINHYETSNKELYSKNEVLTRINNRQQNEINSLKNQLKNMKHEKHIEERNLINERNSTLSLKTKYEVDIKKKNIMISQLQDKLLNRSKKFQTIFEGHNPSFTSTTDIQQDNSKIMNQELEGLLEGLGNLITNLTLQNDKNTKFINYLTSYLTILNDFLIRKLNFQDDIQMVALPPTPKFYYEKFENSQQQELIKSGQDDDITTKISHIIDFQKIQVVVFDNLEKFYEVLTNENYNTGSGGTLNNGVGQYESEKIQQLEQQIVELSNNLNSALETNENWSKRFQALGKQQK